MNAPANRRAWRDKRVWVFDLDNTLYRAECDLFAQIDVRMTEFVSRHLGVAADHAKQLQKQYLVEHGTTLNGLMIMHGVSPRPFLDFVHDIDLSVLPPDPLLADAVAALPGRKLVFTNGSRAHGQRVVDKLGLTHLFEDIFDIEATGYTPKPQAGAYEKLLARHAFAPRAAVFFEDTPRNLAPAAELGFTTVLVHSAKDWSQEPEAVRPAGAGPQPAFVHHSTDDLASFLHGLLDSGAGPAFSGAD